MFDISPPTRRPATAVARRRVGAVVNRLVGMGLKSGGGGGQGEILWHLLSDYQSTKAPVVFGGAGGQGETG